MKISERVMRLKKWASMTEMRDVSQKELMQVNQSRVNDQESRQQVTKVSNRN